MSDEWPLVHYHHHHHHRHHLISPPLKHCTHVQSRPTLRSSMMPTTNNATVDMASLVLAMQEDVASLQTSQTVANREIAYLRNNQDRVIHEVSAEFRRLQRQVRTMQTQFDAMQECQKRLRRRVQRIEANASASRSGSSSVPPIDNQTPNQSRLRHLELRRQGAFQGGDINNLPWDELNDVRGFNPDIPRYHWSGSPPPMRTHNPHSSRKRTRDTFHADSTPFFEQCKHLQHGKANSEGGASPTKRRRLSSAARIARKTTMPYRESAHSRPVTIQNNSTRRSTSFISGVISGVSSVFRS